MAKSITTILYDDNLDGSKTVQMDNCVCLLSIIKRGSTEFIKEMREELSKPALYILLNRENQRAYIGETDVFLKRIANHSSQKDFWNEALAFTANDNSLTTTEVKYLESLAYEAAKSAGTYDLSENYQAPTRPHTTKPQEIKIKEFFKYVLMLTKFIYCDLFEDKQRYAPIIPKHQKSLTIDINLKPQDLEGRIHIVLNGIEYDAKGKLGYAIIKEYLNKYPDTTISDLKEIFNNGLLGRWGAWNLIEENIDYAKSLKEESGQYRHLIKDEFVLTSSDKVKFVVSNQWEKGNIINLLQIANNQGWTYEIKK